MAKSVRNGGDFHFSQRASGIDSCRQEQRPDRQDDRGMRDVAVPLHDGQGIARERAGKDVDVGEHRAEGASNDCGARGGRTQRAGFAAFGRARRERHGPRKAPFRPARLQFRV